MVEKYAAEYAKRTGIMTFRKCASQYIEIQCHGWKNATHAKQWRATIEQYANPVIGDMPANEIDTPHVMTVLRPIWTIKPETVSGRLESILAWATTSKYRASDIQARWRGHLSTLLPKDAWLFESLTQVRELAWQWMLDYNDERPHESLDNVPPAAYRRQLENSGLGLSHQRES